MKGGRFKEWKIACSECDMTSEIWCWSYDFPLPTCTKCGAKDSILPIPTNPASTLMIATDDIPGGIEIRHGLVNDDGSPRKFYSKSDIKREANRRGLTILGDTPKPYKVSWEGKREE